MRSLSCRLFQNLHLCMGRQAASFHVKVFAAPLPSEKCSVQFHIKRVYWRWMLRTLIEWTDSTNEVPAVKVKMEDVAKLANVNKATS